MNLQFPLNESYHAYSHIEIMKVRDKPYIIVTAYNSSENQYAAIIIKKQKTTQALLPLNGIIQQVGPYSDQEELCEELKNKIGEFQSKQIIFGEGILGFHRFLQGYYLHYIAQKQSISKIGRHKINQITKTNTIPLFQLRNEQKDNQNKYKQILSEYKIQNFYYSTSYDLTHSLAKNMIDKAKPFFEVQAEGIKAKPPLTDKFYSNDPNLFGICELFQFNYAIAKEFAETIKNKKWILSVIHGYCKQINDNFKGTIFNIIVIARRNRHHAGTRYIKRGIDADGFVANYVQIEQIVVNYSLSQDTRPMCSSFIQIRGSVPTYWMQRPSIAIPKPAIETRNDDYLFLATRKHFHSLFGRYGKCIFAINLMKIREKTARQSALSKQYNDAVKFINKNDLPEQNSIHYIEVDMKYNLKLDKNIFISKIRTLAYFALQKTGLFICLGLDRSTNDQYVQFQNGVIRANCVDCLDRTNSFQQLVGETVLSVQLARLLKQNTKFQNLQLDERILEKYSQIYERMGDLISIQYGSSYAHKQKIQKTTESRNQFWTSIKRHFNNNLKDYDRQQQIDLFLGFQPRKQGPHIWQIKPSIQHYPSESVKLYEKHNNYFESAYQFFKNQHNFELLKSANNQQKCSYSFCHKFEQFGKDELKSKFQPDIVQNLVNEKQKIDCLKFCLTPKLILQKRVWAEMNPKPKIVESLQQKLSHPYNKMDFLKNAEKSQKIVPLTSKQVLSQSMITSHQSIGSCSGPIKRNKNQSTYKPCMFLKENDPEFNQLCKQYISLEDYSDLDDQQLELIEQTLKGQIVSEELLQEEVNKCFQAVTNDSTLNEHPEEIELSLRLMAQEQIKIIQNNYAKGNYMGINKMKNKKNLLRENRATKKQFKEKQQIKKKDYIKDNRVLMLQQIMQQNFSHGKIKGQITQI